MIYIQTAMEVLVAMFAVIGLYGTARWAMGKLFAPRNIVLTMEILTQREAESAESLIRDALSHYPLALSGRMLLLIRPELAEHPGLLRAAERYGLTCYILEEETADGEEDTK